ncbi:MAG: hypothetical protein IT440_04520 [Phycisphaeraceae bacterium]|nr:hypothetical protein [Phycisphaeraceae bacterium]
MMSSEVKERATPEDVGAAMMAWYADSIRKYPEGLVTQAQAAQMLCVSRMAVSRLVGRGYLRAVYFPKAPEIEGIAVGPDDPMWLKLAGWAGYERDFTFASASYVSFADVLELWMSGKAKEKCKRDWGRVLTNLLTIPTKGGMEKAWDRRRQIRLEYQKLAQNERQQRDQAQKLEGELR